jgi:hypothetical protein
MKIEVKTFISLSIEMEPVLLEEESDLDSVGVDELCQALDKSCRLVTDLYNDTYMQFRGLRKKVKEEMHTLDRQPLKPKPHVKRWLKKHNLPETPTFQEFFEVVCDELQKEDRLDLSQRTLTPTKEIAKLFCVEADSPIHILDFLMQATEVFQ